MNGHHESTGSDPALSSDSVRRVAQYQTAGVNARLRLFALLEAQGMPASEADDLVAALEAGAVAGAQCQVVGLDGMAPASRGSLFADGWDDGVTAASEALVGIADREWSRRGSRSAGTAELAVRIADVRQRERADLVCLEAYVQETVLPSTHPYTTARRRVLEALGEAGGLCTARTRNSDGDVIVCTREAGHYVPDDKPSFKDGKPGGWHKADASIWNDLGAACILHEAI
ncbi:hypothetical protein GCM10018785_26690 [Streptomyces longispororuber]|uniref:Uncharacterized protein n=1 Tax=Streptomyces longispororuber TaxID=68230 RepID=A0A919DM82_9ACTN|nr:hypothetical protein [Streptomyces longispororuber]GHE56072.1 hypothetical protein GCM10018785_26690 [Streptomyces longispororuber]